MLVPVEVVLLNQVVLVEVEVFDVSVTRVMLFVVVEVFDVVVVLLVFDVPVVVVSVVEVPLVVDVDVDVGGIRFLEVMKGGTDSRFENLGVIYQSRPTMIWSLR